MNRPTPRICPRCGGGAFPDVLMCYSCGYDATPARPSMVWRLFLKEGRHAVRTFLIPRKGLIIGGGLWCDVTLTTLDPDDASIRVYPDGDRVILERYQPASNFSGDSTLDESISCMRPLGRGEKIQLGSIRIWAHMTTTP